MGNYSYSKSAKKREHYQIIHKNTLRTPLHLILHRKYSRIRVLNQYLSSDFRFFSVLAIVPVPMQFTRQERNGPI